MAAKTGTYTLISGTTLTTTAASVTFSSIPATYTDLILVVNPTYAINADASITFNGDTANNYSSTYLTGNGTSATSGRFSTMPRIYLDQINTGTTIVQYNASIMDYANTTTFKTVLSRYGGTTKGVEAVVGLWRSTAAITSVLVDGGGANFTSGSTIRLYGIEAAK
jgi:hypothetical protein